MCPPVVQSISYLQSEDVHAKWGHFASLSHFLRPVVLGLTVMVKFRLKDGNVHFQEKG